MAGLKHLLDIYKQKGQKFTDSLFREFVTVNEKIDGSAFCVQKNQEGTILYYKKGKTPINNVDRTLAVYYDRAIDHFQSLPDSVRRKIPPGWKFGFEYIVSQKPNEVQYDRIPTNGLILSYIHILTPEGKISKTIQDKHSLDGWADVLEVERPPILFQGRLTEEQKIKLLDFLNTPFDSLIKKFKTESFVKYIISVLNPRLTKTTLNTDLEKTIEGIVFRFGEDEERIVLAKMVDPVFTDLARKKSKERVDKKPSDIYNLTLIDVMNFINQENLMDHIPRGESWDNQYISFISSIFNAFVAEYGERYKNIDFEVPAYLKRREFALGNKFIANPRTLVLLDDNKEFEQLFKVILAGFRRYKRKAGGLWTASMITHFNKLVNEIHEHIEGNGIGVNESENTYSFTKFLKEQDSAEDGEESFATDFKDTLDPLLDPESTEPAGKVRPRLPYWKKKGKKTVNLIVGRFQPFHNGHMSMVNKLSDKNRRPIVLAVVNNGNNKSRNPLSREVQTAMFDRIKEESNGKIIDVIFVNSGYLEHVIKEIRPTYEPVCIGAGPDRVANYRKQLEYFQKRGDLNVKAEVIETARSMRSTDLRNAIIDGRFGDFKKSVPKCIQTQYPLIQQEISRSAQLQESASLINFPPNMGMAEKAIRLKHPMDAIKHAYEIITSKDKNIIDLRQEVANIKDLDNKKNVEKIKSYYRMNAFLYDLIEELDILKVIDESGQKAYGKGDFRWASRTIEDLTSVMFKGTNTNEDTKDTIFYDVATPEGEFISVKGSNRQGFASVLNNSVLRFQSMIGAALGMVQFEEGGTAREDNIMLNVKRYIREYKDSDISYEDEDQMFEHFIEYLKQSLPKESEIVPVDDRTFSVCAVWSEEVESNSKNPIIRLNFEKTKAVSGEDLIKFALNWMTSRKNPNTSGRLSGATGAFKNWPGGKDNESKALIISDDEAFLQGRAKQKEIIEKIIDSHTIPEIQETIKQLHEELNPE